MSAIISLVTPHAAMMLTDAGFWNVEDQTIVDLKRKVFSAKSVPLAVTARGPSNVTEAVSRYICNWADKHGAEAMIERLQELCDLYRGEGAREGKEGFTVLVAAWLPSAGGVHRLFRSYAAGERRPYEVVAPGETFVAGTSLTGADMMAAGLVKAPMEHVQDFVRRCGADMMESVRRRPQTARTGEQVCVAGGWCDLTVIDADGARTETIRTWPDQVGERIDPYRLPAPTAGMNRKQRRAMRSTA